MASLCLTSEPFHSSFQRFGVVLKVSCLVGNPREICYSETFNRLKERRVPIYLLTKWLIWYQEYSRIIPEPRQHLKSRARRTGPFKSSCKQIHIHWNTGEACSAQPTIREACSAQPTILHAVLGALSGCFLTDVSQLGSIIRVRRLINNANLTSFQH